MFLIIFDSFLSFFSSVTFLFILFLNTNLKRSYTNTTTTKITIFFSVAFFVDNKLKKDENILKNKIIVLCAGYWVFGAQFCDTWVAFDVMCSTASILNLCAISLDRYIHIKDPLR